MFAKVLLPLLISILIVGCQNPESSKELPKEELVNHEITNEISQENINKESDVSMKNMILEVNGKQLEVVLAENSATKALREKLEKEEIRIHAREYGNFEKVGDLGFSLPTSDERVITEAGDIVLYQGNQVSIFYNSNSWSYTRLGKIQNVTQEELKEILGNGDVEVILKIEK